MKVSVILIGYNSWRFLKKNLASLAFLEKNPEAEIIYVDNASADGTVFKIREYYPFIKVFENETNKGVAVARNRGIKKAIGEYLWILDSDTEVTEEALNTMLAFMDEHPEAGLCGCKMYGKDGCIQDSCRPYPSIKGKLNAGSQILLEKLRLPFSFCPAVFYDKNRTYPFEVDYVIGACQLIRKKAQQEVGLLDEKIFYGPEDADFCFRMKQAGYKVYYIPQVRIFHAYQRISLHRVFSKMNGKHILGLCYYFWKHRKYRPTKQVVETGN
jgi:GT2 family glycosyltransferase